MSQSLQQAFRLLGFTLCIALFAFPAHATVGSILCDIYNNELIGGVAPGIATMAVIALGISAALGKTSFGAAVTVAIGIAILFGAVEIVAAFGATGCPPPP
jgi:type IV secretory pathway VirB2 component (pilin)